METFTDYFLVELRQQLVYQAQTFLFPCAFASKRVFVKNLSHENETVQGTHLHTHGFAPGLVLTERQKATRELHINAATSQVY